MGSPYHVNLSWWNESCFSAAMLEMNLIELRQCILVVAPVRLQFLLLVSKVVAKYLRLYRCGKVSSGKSLNFGGFQFSAHKVMAFSNNLKGDNYVDVHFSLNEQKPSYQSTGRQKIRE